MMEWKKCKFCLVGNKIDLITCRECGNDRFWRKELDT